MTTIHHEREDEGAETSDRPSFMRVESFLHEIDDRRQRARRSRWIALGVAVAVGGVATLTALGVVPPAAENAVISASAVVAGFALSKE
jgi:hypothetical protein